MVDDSDACPVYHLKIQAALLLVGVESTPVGSKVDFSCEGSGEIVGGLNGTGVTMEMGECVA
ncbi:MAG: hypothetical protein Q9196_005507, partial [Gyalolechia fulgens]